MAKVAELFLGSRSNLFRAQGQCARAFTKLTSEVEALRLQATASSRTITNLHQNRLVWRCSLNQHSSDVTVAFDH
jgi:hypothetical protein